MSRTIAIGDVHGCSQELKDLLDKLEVTEDDHVIFLGDLVNRGPDTPGVFDLVRSLKNVTCVMGNHELRLLEYKKKGKLKGLKPVEKETIAVLRPEDWEIIESMVPTYYSEEHETVFVHAGFVPGTPWNEQPLEVVCNVQVISPEGEPRMREKYPKDPFWANFWHGPPYVVYGHTPRTEVERHAWSLGIDTACVGGNYLTAYILPEKEIVQVPANKAYYE